MAITVGSNSFATGATPYTTPVVDSGSNRIFIAVATQTRSPPNITDSATLGGVAATGNVHLITGVSSYTGCRVAMWYWLESALVSVGTGTKTLTFTGSDTVNVVAWLNATEVAQSAPETSATSDEGSFSLSHAITLSSVTSGALVVMVGRNGAVNFSSYTNGTGIITTGQRAAASYRTDGSTLTFATGTVEKSLLAAASFAPAGVAALDPIVMKWRL